MAANTFDALMAEVNAKISQADTAASGANAAAVQANAAAQSADAQTQLTSKAAQEAQEAAADAAEQARKWEEASVEARTGDAGGEASVELSEENGMKKISFVLPRGKDGAAGAKGDTGRSGVTFSLSGTRLYITTG